jgi:hypothetical protein
VEIEEDLRAELTLRHAPPPSVQLLAERVSSICSVAIHLRGLYNASATGKIVTQRPTLPYGYYQSAISVIRRELDSPHFFIFSDGTNPRWLGDLCPSATLIPESCEEAEDHDELWLMSRCKHHVIASSTFSWWAASLGDHPQHLVLSPNMSKYGQLMSIPRHWTVIES